MQKKEPTIPPSQKVLSSRKRGPQATRSSQPPQTPLKPQLAVPHTPEEWRAHWQAQGQPWRTEPEINQERQEELAKCRAIVPDIEKGIYPFSGMKLTRADIEWLLATHENGRGPVDWSDESQRLREGLDLRGADVRGNNLTGLPLARLIGGLSYDELQRATPEQKKRACVVLTGADLVGARLEGAKLIGVRLPEANLFMAHLEKADLTEAQLAGADLSHAELAGADLGETQLAGANFTYARLAEADLYRAQLQGAILERAQLQKAHLRQAQLQQAKLTMAQLQQADLIMAQLQQADLAEAQLAGADLRGAQLERIDLRAAQLEGAKFEDAILVDNDHIGPCLADVQWGTSNLTDVDWSQVVSLGDEREAREQLDRHENRKAKHQRLREYQAAVRANRQFSVALQGQGLNEDAARFAYRAQTLQKDVYRFQMIQDFLSLRQQVRELGSWLFSWFLFLLAGYGYKPLRSFLAYLLVIAGFATAYYVLGLHDLVGPHHLPGPHYLSWYEAVVVSMTAFPAEASLLVRSLLPIRRRWWRPLRKRQNSEEDLAWGSPVGYAWGKHPSE